jgi:hypothetical protein
MSNKMYISNRFIILLSTLIIFFPNFFNISYSSYNDIYKLSGPEPAIHIFKADKSDIHIVEGNIANIKKLREDKSNIHKLKEDYSNIHELKQDKSNIYILNQNTLYLF